LDELKNKSPAEVLPRGTFDIEQLEKKAVLNFSRCPKFVTWATHVNLADVTPVSCYLNTGREVSFSVPKQRLDMRTDKNGVRYLVVQVMDSEGSMAIIVVREADRKGFLIPDDDM
jgi:hypothetical protein